MESPLSRRGFLRAGMLGALVTVLAACQSSQSPAPPASSPAAQTAAIPPTPVNATSPSGTATAPPSQSASNPAGAEPVTLTFGTWFTEGTDPIQPLFPKFEQAHNAKIKVELIPRDQIMTKYTALFVSGTAQDVQNGDNFSWSKFYDANYILDLAPYLKADNVDLTKDYSLIGSEIWCGKTYGMPFQLGTRAVYYNKTMLKSVGAPDPWDDLKGQWTFDDVAKIAQQATKSTNGKAEQWGIDMAYDGMAEVMGMFIWTFGGTWADFENMKYTLTSKESIAAHQYVYDWVVNKKIVITNEDSSSLVQIGVKNTFTGGKTAMWVRASASTPTVVQGVADRFEWDIAPWPSDTRGKPGVSLVSGNPHTVYAKSKSPDLAYQFVKFLAGDDVQKFFADGKAQIPTLRSYQDEYSKDPKRHTSVFTDILKQPYGIHFRHYNTVQVYADYTDAMEQVYLQKQDVTKVLTDFNAKANNEVKYGACTPYRGWTVPVKPFLKRLQTEGAWRVVDGDGRAGE